MYLSGLNWVRESRDNWFRRYVLPVPAPPAIITALGRPVCSRIISDNLIIITVIYYSYVKAIFSKFVNNSINIFIVNVISRIIISSNYLITNGPIIIISYITPSPAVYKSNILITVV